MWGAPFEERRRRAGRCPRIGTRRLCKGHHPPVEDVHERLFEVPGRYLMRLGRVDGEAGDWGPIFDEDVGTRWEVLRLPWDSGIILPNGSVETGRPEEPRVAASFDLHLLHRPRVSRIHFIHILAPRSRGLPSLGRVEANLAVSRPCHKVPSIRLR